MNIISGAARGVELLVPDTLEVRPTSGRARKALFDSLGNLQRRHVLDLFSGSGALALESATRGAASIAMVELSPEHIRCIEENLRRCTAAGVDCPAKIIQRNAVEPETYLPMLRIRPDLIFADPPYVESVKFFIALLANDYFRKSLSGAKMIWEIPDTPGAAGNFLNHPAFSSYTLRRFGGTLFFIGVLQ